MSELTAREKITKYCEIRKEAGRRGDVLIYGRHKHRMNRLVANLTDAECEKVVGLMELDAYIAKVKGTIDARSRATVRVEAKPCECGCGETASRGSHFRPGHDARLKSALREAADGGDGGAKKELVSRGWVRDAGKKPGPRFT